MHFVFAGRRRGRRLLSRLVRKGNRMTETMRTIMRKSRRKGRDLIQARRHQKVCDGAKQALDKFENFEEPGSFLIASIALHITHVQTNPKPLESAYCLLSRWNNLNASTTAPGSPVYLSTSSLSLTTGIWASLKFRATECSLMTILSVFEAFIGSLYCTTTTAV